MQGTEDGPSEIEDEYQLGLAIGVDDESSEQATSISFSITSYGADYPTPSSSCNRRTRPAIWRLPNGWHFCSIARPPTAD